MSSLMDLLQSKKAALSANRRAKTVKPEDGRSRWRILPGWRKPGTDNAEQFWHDFGSHFIKDASGEMKAVYICTEKTFNKPCAICASINAAIKATDDEETKKLYGEARAAGRILLNALRIDGEDPTKPVLLEVPPTVFESMINIINEWGVEVLSLDKGMDFVIERSGKGKLTKYSVQVGSKSASVDPSVMKGITNLDDYVAQESEENMQRALSSFRAVAGLLPSSSVVTPAASKPAMSELLVDDADDADLAALEKTITDEPVTAGKTPANAVETAPATESVASGDAELDELLAALG